MCRFNFYLDKQLGERTRLRLAETFMRPDPCTRFHLDPVTG